jgi:heme-degrading monooxygenase HmoA
MMREERITRIWHGRTRAEHAEEYLQFLIDTGVPDYKSVPGNLSVEIWREIDGEVCHFWTVTKWDSFDSIKQFAGEDYEKAKYYAEDDKYLLEFEPNVRHCETFEF